MDIQMINNLFYGNTKLASLLIDLDNTYLRTCYTIFYDSVKRHEYINMFEIINVLDDMLLVYVQHAEVDEKRLLKEVLHEMYPYYLAEYMTNIQTDDFMRDMYSRISARYKLFYVENPELM